MIRNIVFDLGAVLIDIDFDLAKKAFEKIGISNFDQHYTQVSASGLFDALEKGNCSPQEFYQAIQQIGNPSTHKIEIQQAWNSILLDFRKESMEYVATLKSSYRLFLLSNTNAIHMEEINRRSATQLGVNNLDDFFEKAYYSFAVGMRKPQEEIFEYVIKDAAILPQETIFIDDAQPNIHTAIKMGFQTHLLLKGEKVEQVLATLLNT